MAAAMAFTLASGPSAPSAPSALRPIHPGAAKAAGARPAGPMPGDDMDPMRPVFASAVPPLAGALAITGVLSAAAAAGRRKQARGRGVFASTVLALGRLRRAGTLRAAPSEQTAALAPAAQGTVVRSGDVDDVETCIADFVPKIAQLQNQAELLRDGELRTVLETMKELRKTELRGVFSEVDQLLCALIDSIHGLRDSALEIRENELRHHFDEFEQGQVVQEPVPIAQDSEVDTMMEVHVIGLSHHSAPVEVREKLAVLEADWNNYAQELVEFSQGPNGYIVPEVAVLSTCNRFELYFASPELKKFPAVECVRAFLRRQSGLSREELDPYLFVHTGEAATNHLFEVSSGLDSLVLGEAQILAQVKACYGRCIEKPGQRDEDSVAGSGGKFISKMLNAGIRMGKLVRTRTKIGKGSVSVSSAAVELMMSRAIPDIGKRAGDLKVCILGAGKMGRLLLIALFTKHPDIQVTVVNRSVDKATALLEELANRGGSRAKVSGLDSQWDVVGNSDVVFAATSSTEPVISAEDLRRIGLDRKMMLIDISVPRNIAADCVEVSGVQSYSVDDLKKVVQANAEKRQAEVIKAKSFIGEEVKKFKLWQASQGAVPYLAALQERADEIRRDETEKMARKLNGLEDREREAVDKLTRHIVDSIFEPIYYSMKDEEDIDTKKKKIWSLKNIFKLNPVYKRRLLPQGAKAPQLNA